MTEECKSGRGKYSKEEGSKKRKERDGEPLEEVEKERNSIGEKTSGAVKNSLSVARFSHVTIRQRNKYSPPQVCYRQSREIDAEFWRNRAGLNGGAEQMTRIDFVSQHLSRLDSLRVA